MRKMDLLVDREVLSIADSGRCGGPFPTPSRVRTTAFSNGDG
jgi:hypothetical protein